MGGNNASGSALDPLQGFWEEKRKAFLNAMNDRIRTTALGSLVLIWGLFIGDEHKGVTMGSSSRIALLAVAFGSIAVLLIEYVEQWTGYLGARQVLPHSTVKPYGFPYTAVSRRAFYMKHVIGVVTMIALLVVVGTLLIQTVVRAQDVPDISSYVGEWCGSDQSGNNYMHLSIEFESNGPLVKFGWKGEALTACTIDHANAIDGEFKCTDSTQREWDLVVKKDGVNLDVTRHESSPDPNGTPTNQTLSDCNPQVSAIKGSS